MICEHEFVEWDLNDLFKMSRPHVQLLQLSKLKFDVRFVCNHCWQLTESYCRHWDKRLPGQTLHRKGPSVVLTLPFVTPEHGTGSQNPVSGWHPVISIPSSLVSPFFWMCLYMWHKSPISPLFSFNGGTDGIFTGYVYIFTWEHHATACTLAALGYAAR